MFGPVVGNFFSSLLEFLYEQCSLHMTEKIPSSVKFGSRPRIFLIRLNSSGVSPCFATISGVTSGSRVAVGIETGRLAKVPVSSNRGMPRRSPLVAAGAAGRQHSLAGKICRDAAAASHNLIEYRRAD